MQSSKKLSIIIINYRSEQYLEKCIASIYNWSDSILFEIIVVNNDSDCDLGKIAKKYEEVRILDSQKNIGFGAACNLGAKRATGEALLFLNPDTQLLDSFPLFVTEEFEKDEKIGVIGPKLMTEEGEIQWWCAGKSASLWQVIKNNLGMIESKKIWESDEEIFADWVSGAALAVRKDLFQKVGGFDEDFFMYFEDDDLCRKIRSLGRKVLYQPKFSVLHFGGKSRKSLLKQKIQFYKSLFYYLKKKRTGPND